MSGFSVSIVIKWRLLPFCLSTFIHALFMNKCLNVQMEWNYRDCVLDWRFGLGNGDWKWEWGLRIGIED